MRTNALNLGLPTLLRKTQSLIECAQHDGAMASLAMFEVVARKAEALDVPSMLTLLTVGA